MWGFPLEFCNGTWAQKLRLRKIDDKFTHIDTIHDCDGQTDGQQNFGRQLVTMVTHSVAR